MSLNRWIWTGGVTAIAVALLTAFLFVAPRPVAILDAPLSDDGTTLRLSVASCNADTSYQVIENEAAVGVLVKAKGGAHDCADGVTITLDEALGDRELVDRSNLSTVEVRRPPSQEP